MYDDSLNPWANYLVARAQVIHWLADEKSYSNADIAQTISVDEEQVFLIRRDTQYQRPPDRTARVCDKCQGET